MEQKSSQPIKVLLKIYDSEEVAKFQNEVEKLNLLNQIMEEIGQQGFLVQVIESFSCQVGAGVGNALCIVMEHLEMSLADYVSSLPNVSGGTEAQNTTNNNVMTLEYSISEEESACLSIDEKHSQSNKSKVNNSRRLA